MFIAKSCTVTVSVMAWVEENVASPVVTKENVQFFFLAQCISVRPSVKAFCVRMREKKCTREDVQRQIAKRK